MLASHAMLPPSSRKLLAGLHLGGELRLARDVAHVLGRRRDEHVARAKVRHLDGAGRPQPRLAKLMGFGSAGTPAMLHAAP